MKDESAWGCRNLHTSNGLSIRALPDGCIYSIECGETQINQILASPLAGGVHRIYLRLHGRGEIEWAEIVGPAATRRFAVADDRFVWSGEALRCGYRCTCWPHPSGEAWFFHVEIESRTDQPIRADVIMVQDLGLATRGQVRNNESFNSQYLDHAAFEHPQLGHVLMTRQNLPQPNDTHPWLMQGCVPKAAGFTTDAFDFFGVEYRRDRIPAALARPIIGQRVRQYEMGCAAIQGAEAELKPASSRAWTFFAHFVANHPQPSSPDDLERIEVVEAMRRDLLAALAPSSGPPGQGWGKGSSCIFRAASPLRAEDLSDGDIERLFPSPRRHEERLDDQLASFFHGEDSRHVVLQAKERASPRPHGHIMRAGRGEMPDDELMSCTFYAGGGFASQLTLGNTSLAKLLSGVRDPLNLVRSSGLRIFVRFDPADEWQLLQVPSAFEMSLDSCRWFYKRGQDLLVITCTASADQPALGFDIRIEGRPIELLISGELAAGAAEYETSPRIRIDRAQGRISVRPDPQSLLGKKQPGIVFHIDADSPQQLAAIGGDELLFSDGHHRGLPYFALRTVATNQFAFSFRGRLDEAAPAPSAAPAAPASAVSRRRIGQDLRLSLPDRAQGQQLADVLAWFARDAMVHLSIPRGLEQANGGAWGVRDVCQGPVELLLAYEQSHLVADILRIVFAQQYDGRGDWPQWFMFPPFNEIQSSHCHGDNMIWPLKALCEYLEHTSDESILHERIAYTNPESFQPAQTLETILQHVDRLIDKMQAEFLTGLSLPRYGEGDWDDSLQPADPMLRERMVSSWTCALMYQTLRRYGEALAHFGHSARAAAVDTLAGRIEADFQRHLMPDGVVAGFALFEGQPPRPREYLLHPSDTRTGLRYRLIPMTRSILSGIFTRAQAETHVELIRQHLLFPDGARLMDRPTTYEGGRQRTFRRSESAAFFGREIGLQYVHAHLRYAEALARMGRADELWRALRVVNPIAVTDVVQNARPRQRNCYFSSSDAAFTDRYHAQRDYDKLRRGEVPVDGGWRIYSSGPGIYTSLVIRHLFGIRRRFGWLEIDPVLPRELSGAWLELPLAGRNARFEFRVAPDGAPKHRLLVNNHPLPQVQSAPNAYRAGGLSVPQDVLTSALTHDRPSVQVIL